MIDLKIALPKGFLDEEVRCGYTVTNKMKEVWAVERSEGEGGAGVNLEC